MKKGGDLEDRLIDFGVSVIKLVRGLPSNFIGKHFSRQLLRSGTAPAAHYAEARGAESQRDFIHKLRLGLKELNESQIWLKMIDRSRLIHSNNVRSVLDECIQLSRIFNASINTAKRKLAISK
ncbi:MAG: four helix bundle protein [Ardenticatenaceae bacterium]|nr:four helix bundle protein [Ardenticatenaceae bacterium]